MGGARRGAQIALLGERGEEGRIIDEAARKADGPPPRGCRNSPDRRRAPRAPRGRLVMGSFARRAVEEQLDRTAVMFGKRHEVELALAVKGRARRSGTRAEPLQQIVGEIPIGVRKALSRARCAAVLVRAAFASAARMPSMPRRARARAARRFRARRGMLDLGARQSEAHERMREKRQRPHGLRSRRPRPRQAAQGFPPAYPRAEQPAESSTAMPQRASSAETRAASARSGVTRAAFDRDRRAFRATPSRWREPPRARPSLRS